jgi:hypothetical protein
MNVVRITKVSIDLPINQGSGFVFSGSPPRVSQILESSLRETNMNLVGYFFCSLEVPNLVISNVVDTNRLHKILHANQHLLRKIILCDHPPALNALNDCRYEHTLPIGLDLGISFTGFPAQIESVSPDSPFARKVHPSQMVEAVVVPGQPILNTHSPGFTGHRVREFLDLHSSVPKRLLIVKDQLVVYTSRDRNESAAFDSSDCCRVL